MTFRGQIVLWTSCVTGLAMAATGLTIGALNLQRMSAAIDRELRDRGRFVERDPPPFAGPLPTGDAFADRMANVRRPRRFGVDGQPFGAPGPNAAFDLGAVKEALKGKEVFSKSVYQGSPVRVFTFPVFRDGHIDHVSQIARDLQEFYDARAIQSGTFFLVLPVGLVAAAGVGVFLSRRLTRPLRETREAAEEIASGAYERRLKVQGGDEIGQMAASFNHMAETVEQHIARLNQALDQQRRFTSDASHELKTPLTRMMMATSSGLEGDAEEQRRALTVADGAARDMQRLVGQLLDLAKLDSATGAVVMAPCDVRVVLSDAVDKSPSPAPEVDVDLPDAPVMSDIDANMVERAIVNLVENAKRYSPVHQKVKISMRLVDEGVEIAVSDKGPGVSPVHLPRLTERFYRIDDARDRDGGGTGLGLAIVDEIARAHGGALKLENSPTGGLTAKLWLPLRSVTARVTDPS